MTTPCHLCQLCRKPVFHQFSNDELICIQHLKTGEQTVRTRSLVLLPGATQTAPRTVLAGWAFIYRTLTDGERQILDFLLPGDLIGIQALVSNTSEYGVQALTPLKLCVFAGLHLDKLFREQVGLLESFSRTLVHDQQRLYERLVSLGRRSATQGLAHLILELADRAQARSFDSSTRYPFPLRRQHMADALGLSGTQVSRSAAELRDRGLAEFGHGALDILDRRALEKLADYSRPIETAYRFML